jgi:AraC family transcriptional regulator
MKIWQQVRKDLAAIPIVEGMVWGQNPIYVERYFFRGIEKTVRGLDDVGLVVQFGGGRVREGEAGHWRAESLPSQGVLLPARCATHWHYSGFVDFAVFYFPDHVEGVLGRLRRLTDTKSDPLVFSDPVVSANALALTEELRKGPGADDKFAGVLAGVVLEQTYRVLTTPQTTHLNPRHIHFDRLNRVLTHIREHLADDLSIASLAARAQVSVPHFRRLFHEAMGVPVHQFVLTARLEQARKLLTMTGMPLSRIADECGFSSQSHLATSFRAVHAATPTEFRTQTRPSGGA